MLAAAHVVCVTLASFQKTVCVCVCGECEGVGGVIAVNVGVADSVCTLYFSVNKCYEATTPPLKRAQDRTNFLYL